MGISRDTMHKRKATGAAPSIYHKKRLYMGGRQPSMTKLVVRSSKTKQQGKKVTSVRVRGGSIKRRALRLETGNFIWHSAKKGSVTRILSVCYNSTSNELVRTNTLVKSCIVYIDAAPFAAVTGIESETATQVKTGKVLAKITSRPGQQGRADGYILEGAELAFYQKKLAAK
ncbi:40S ribosomal protein S8 [Spironucleus salmonicida]|uniref:40S ribosomal protein S8 n=1 Tax=Spironucleus salmonicida TaxID=348837 RepID=V6LU07_9EUKA|nr:40S ribosomal protein S8 [Spironucleus salmonicida]|eukprot:EST44269.1 Ribosomal protein S8 [Spironucleus salmonicida]